MHCYCDDRGHSFMSILDHLAEIPGQVNASLMYAGAVKAWHRHARQDDYWVVVAGDLKVGLYNSDSSERAAELRLAAASADAERVMPIAVAPGTGRAVYLGEHQPGVLRIPPGLWHGGLAVGGRDALLLYYVTRKYDPQHPDEQREPWDRFPFSWAVEFK